MEATISYTQTLVCNSDCLVNDATNHEDVEEILYQELYIKCISMGLSYLNQCDK